MDIEYLREFYTVADELNYTRATKTLHTTQSTLSKHISALEHDLGCELFKRNRTGVELTEEGTLLYRKAHMIVDLYAEAKADVKKLATKPRIRISGMLQNGEVVSILSRAASINASDEGGQFTFIPLATQTYIRSLLHGDTDIVLCHDASLTHQEPQLARRVIMQTPFVAIVESDHPLAGNTSVRVEDLAAYPLVQIIDETSKYGWQRIECVCEAHGFTPRRYPLLVNGMLDCLTEQLGDAVLILQRLLLPTGALAGGDHRVIAVEGDGAYFELCAYCRAEDERRLAGFLDILVQAGEDTAVALQTPAVTRPFQTRCRSLAARRELNDTETAAMISFAKGRSIERIGTSLGMTRMMCGDLLANVYRKLGVNDKQELLDLIEAEPLV